MLNSVLFAVIFAVFITQLSILLTTVYLHRSLSHKSLKLSPPVEFVVRMLLWLTTGIQRREWVGVHRLHHAHTDVLGDPHSPIVESYWKIQLLNLFYYRRAAKNREAIQRYTKDLPPDRWDRWLFSHSYLGLGLGIGILIGLFGVELAIVVALIHLVLYLGLSAAVNAIGHRFGKRPFDNFATNNQWLALLTFGEGLHNNHHELPTAANLAFVVPQIDLGWYVIRSLEMLHLASVRTLKRKVA
ncbi:fatty acid desaturase [Ferrimicrobium acidiphilum]|jgi:stearoyl-CoA desaturase (delta-9 desaturase)|uniref:Fatty acid desaturase n=1 Tax=Ferrimicrobium acidiphilum DSM 19497 TaxID=1121877 RepID=A0A0D8FV63_9ACTN|nr:fatty acid desaturase [Ferrimicrobium acidiphilum]KJE77183.1 fatty acid desaturase [Ferrimicrobium acidiphilum DSM 19497]MCL5053557.1 fatty acid desaturase [Gammaproteobacteria bacterium]